MDFKNKHVLVIGAGISGEAAALIAKRFGAEVTLSDAKDEANIKYDLSKLKAAGVKLVFGPQQNSLLDGVDLMILSPAVPLAIPLAGEAAARGIEVIGEVELAYRLAKSPILAVTGTNGKTTTVTLLGELLKASFKNVGVGGNIGIPLSEEVLRVGEGGIIAAEISSYQMETAKNFHPHIAAVLNVTPDHIVRHGSMEVYQAMKERIFARENSSDYLVLNYDDENTRGMGERADCPVCYFSHKKVLAEGATVENGKIVINWQGKHVELVKVDELGIKGAHNLENALAASAVAYLAGVVPEKMTAVLRNFKGVEHRIEYVTAIDDVPYYNDSKATNTDSAIKALETFPPKDGAGTIILIAGGDDKMTDLTEFMGLVKERVAKLILVGDAAARFKEAALENGYPAENIFEAGYSMEKAVEIAHANAKKGQVVLLSPACASFDMYDGFEERGRDFKKIVRSIEG